MTYKVHHFPIRMTLDQVKLEQFLNSLKGEVISIIPNVRWFPKTEVDFLMVIEKTPGEHS